MRNLRRKPLLWMVVAECAVVSALVIVAWHMVAGVPAQEAAIPPAASPASAAADGMGPVSVDLTPPSNPATSSLLPGLNVNVNFWRSRLVDLNRSEAAFELLEWRLVHSAMDTIHRYVESVVLPSITRAEGRSGR
jgi:hypothetical protein